jgi:hypothetical protein
LCWLLPIAPVMFWWDGIVSCLRMWTDQQWQQRVQRRPHQEQPTIKNSTFCKLLVWQPSARASPVVLAPGVDYRRPQCR